MFKHKEQKEGPIFRTDKITLQLSGSNTSSLEEAFNKNFDAEDKVFFRELRLLTEKCILLCLGIRSVFAASRNLYAFAYIQTTGEIDSESYIEDYSDDPFENIKRDYRGGAYLLVHQYKETNDQDKLTIRAFFQGREYTQTTIIDYVKDPDVYIFRGVRTTYSIRPMEDSIAHPLETTKNIIRSNEMFK